MKSSDKFHEFLSEFLYLAAEAGVVEDDWKDELYPKIMTELQKLTMPEAIKNGTFAEFSGYCSQTASHIEVINHCNQKNCNFMVNSGKTTSLISVSKNSSQTSVVVARPIKKESSDDQFPYLDALTCEKLMKEGRCFKCKEQGHISPNCPNNPPRTNVNPNTQLKELEHTTKLEKE